MTPVPAWDFGYAPVTPAAGAEEAARDLVVATPAALDPAHLATAAGPGARADTLLARAPLFWTRLHLEQPALAGTLAHQLRAAGLAIRYVASAERPSLAPAPALDFRGAPVARPSGWAHAGATLRCPPPAGELHGSWFLRRGEGGVAVDRARFGAGAGTRLAVIDDDALEAEQLDLDAEVLIETSTSPRHQAHGALMVAWATRARRFEGVAPGASARLYVIPKPGRSLVALPLAIARAVADGADVVVCATYVEGSASPMLDDALELSARLGRRGRGAAVVLPTGREASSPPGSLHASFSLGLGEPASDPRVFCIAPGARGAGWFLWHDGRSRLHPFANRGPAVRWLAPGDDVAYPFPAEGAAARLCHAESSGAAAIAAGVLLLVIAANPSLRLSELGAVVDATLAAVDPAIAPGRTPLADAADALPAGRDPDGHNAKHGLGLLDAGRACLAAADPVCGALLAMGEDDAARAWADARGYGGGGDPTITEVYSRRLARWTVRALLADGEAAQALRVILRHLRLASRDETRLAAHGEGALARQLAFLVRRLCIARLPAPAAVQAEMRGLAHRLESAWCEHEDENVASGPERRPWSVAHVERTLAEIASRCFTARST
jgi:hypothetical protein